MSAQHTADACRRIAGHSSATLEALFQQCFFARYQTLLVGGGSEPLYQPADATSRYHRIIYRDTYFASALHEIAHWCLAGDERRKLVDYGYWYHPDSRSTAQQRAFERIEVKPQALECLFAEAAGHPFHISLDNLGNGIGDTDRFERAVAVQAETWRDTGLPARAAQFRAALAAHFARPATGSMDPGVIYRAQTNREDSDP